MPGPNTLHARAGLRGLPFRNTLGSSGGSPSVFFAKRVTLLPTIKTVRHGGSTNTRGLQVTVLGSPPTCCQGFGSWKLSGASETVEESSHGPAREGGATRRSSIGFSSCVDPTLSVGGGGPHGSHKLSEVAPTLALHLLRHPS